MNWTKLIKELEQAGLKQTFLAKECGTSQSVISQLLTGYQKTCRYEVGIVLVSIHKKVMEELALKNSQGADD